MQPHSTSTQQNSARRPVLLTLAGLLAGLSLSACAPATSTGMTTAAAATTPTATATMPATPAYDAIVARLSTAGEFNTFLRLLDQSGLATTLGNGEYTIFVPTDTAFSAPSAPDLTALSADPARLRQVLLYHIVRGSVSPEQVRNGTQLTTLQGAAVATASTSTGATFGAATLRGLSPIVSAGVTVYPIDRVLLPPTP